MPALEELRYWVALNLIPSLTPRKFHLLLGSFPSPEAIWRASAAELEAVPGFARSVATFVRQREELERQGAVDRELEEISKRGLKVLTLASPDYPRPLRALDTPPPVLYLQGDYQERDELALAIVGTRRCTNYGRLIAESLARELSDRGFTIVSGLALGIDTAAHRGALAAGGRTLAVLGSGLADPYPKPNRRLLEEIAASGGVFTEFPLHTPPERWNFPRRNRIISGLARGVVVVEAPERSGALITANLALEQGREVFAVPGRVTDEASRGAHRLLKSGAKLVESVEDILEEFPDLQPILIAQGHKPRERPELTEVEAQVLEALDWEPQHFDDVLEATGLGHAELAHALLQLQFKDLVKELPGKRYAKLP